MRVVAVHWLKVQVQELSTHSSKFPRKILEYVAVLTILSRTGSTKTLGYVALDSKNKLIVVAIQGTQIWSNPIDVITDGDLLQVKSNLCGSSASHDGCSVHKGFLEAMEDASTVVVPAVQEALKANPSFKVVVTGHSLGGAISALLGTLLRNNGMTVDMVRSPRSLLESLAKKCSTPLASRNSETKISPTISKAKRLLRETTIVLLTITMLCHSCQSTHGTRMLGTTTTRSFGSARTRAQLPPAT